VSTSRHIEQRAIPAEIQIDGPPARCGYCHQIIATGHAPWCRRPDRKPKAAKTDQAQAQLFDDATTFSKPVGEAAKRIGMEQAAENRSELLAQVQAALIEIAMRRDSREATADDGQEWLIQHGYHPSDLGNAAGSMFPRDRWICVGTRNSSRVSRHANQIRIWRLK
jgi:hypothetical protein